MWCFVNKVQNKDIPNNLKISSRTWIRFKNKLIQDVVTKLSTQQRKKIGGPQHTIQIDETYLWNRRSRIRCPTRMPENQQTPFNCWLVGGIHKDNGSFFISRVPDRSFNSIKDVFEKFILPGSTVLTDGFRVYPPVCQALNLSHSVAPHHTTTTSIKGRKFIKHQINNSRGENTNSFEIFWRPIKDLMRSRHGIDWLKIDQFLEEYEFLCCNIHQNKHDDKIKAFILITKFFLGLQFSCNSIKFHFSIKIFKLLL